MPPGVPWSVSLSQLDETLTEAFLVLQKAAMEERLRRKAELQKKASRPMGYSASLKGEMSKQKELKKSKEEMRLALCEELGRGC